MKIGRTIQSTLARGSESAKHRLHGRGRSTAASPPIGDQLEWPLRLVALHPSLRVANLLEAGR